MFIVNALIRRTLVHTGIVTAQLEGNTKAQSAAAYPELPAHTHLHVCHFALVQLLHLEVAQLVQCPLAAFQAYAQKQMIVSKAMLLITG